MPASLRVISAISDAEDIPATELDPIHESLDLEALDALVASGDANLSIQWRIYNSRIEIDGTGAIRVL